MPAALSADAIGDRRPDRWVFAGVLALLAWLPLPWGSKPAAATALFAFIAAVLAGVRVLLAMRGAAPPPLPRAARWVLGFWLAWLAWCGLYLAPLPPAVLAAVAPSAHAVHAAIDGLPGASPLYTLSVLPGASLVQLLPGMGYLALFWLVLVCCARDRARQRLALTVILFSGVAQALYGAVMTLSGVEYGFLEPKAHGLGWATGTFVNRNHFAGYLELALAAGIALVLADLRATGPRTWRERVTALVELALSPRMRTRLMIVVMVVALILSRSRMGNVAFFVALALCGTLYVLLRHPRYLVKSLLLFASLVLVDLLIVSEHYGLQKVAERIEQTDFATEQRAVAFRDLVPVLREHGLVGAGPGTFAAVFAPHRSPGLRGFYDHAHNDYAEFVIETGIVGAALLAAIAGTTLAHGVLVLRRRRDPAAAALAFAGLMALVSLGIHGLVDFNLRIPAVAGTLVALMALTLSCSSRSSQAAPQAEPPA